MPYDDLRLSGAPGEYVVASWNMKRELGRELLLTDGDYKCPACGAMTLRFSDGGALWD